jgi:CubicO group peptidase (beta-lactamase class C family)
VTRVDSEIGGRVARGFEPVANTFAEVVEDGAFAAVADGELVVDLWAGEGWREDTLALVFSGTKGLVAVCLLLLVERGLLDLDAPVAQYWPEFPAHGKDGVLVRHAVSHTAGVPGLRDGFGAADLLDGARMRAAVAAEAPFWAPGSTLAYHALTFGWICDELVRRTDGRSVGRFLADEIADPLGLELWIGLPQDEEHRVVELARAEGYGPTVVRDESALLYALYGDLFGGEFPWNEPAFHRAEIPGVNAIGTARSLAALYGSLDRVLLAEALALGRRELSRGVCAVTGRPYAFGVGFELQTELAAFGPPRGAFGHTGSGGSRHGAWPEEGVGFSFVPSELWAEADDGRGRALLRALHHAVAAR